MKKSIQNQYKPCFIQGIPESKWKVRYVGKWLALIYPTFLFYIYKYKMTK